MPVKHETAQVPVILTGKEWAALCVRFVFNESLSEESGAVADLVKLKIMQQVYLAPKALIQARVPPRQIAIPAGLDRRLLRREVDLGWVKRKS